MQATVKWSADMRFEGTGNGGHSVQMDGENKAGNSPMELVLIALCGCTAFDVVSILQKKTRAVHNGASQRRGGESSRSTTCIYRH